MIRSIARVAPEQHPAPVPERAEALREARVDAHEVVLGAIERLRRRRVREEARAAEEELRLMAGDGVALPLNLWLGELQHRRDPRAGAAAVDDERHDLRVARR